MRQLLVDQISLITLSEVITESIGIGKRPRLIGKIQCADQKNGNGRVYPRETLIREVQNFIDGPLQTNTATGELDHASDSIIHLSNVSHVFRRIWWEGDDVMGELELLTTPSGKIAMAILEAGIPLGISSRGLGSVKQLGETVEVQDDFNIITWDLVSIPSTPGAYMNLKEGIDLSNRILNKYSKANKTITDIICNLTGVCALCP